jgi:hypothetical protein
MEELESSFVVLVCEEDQILVPIELLEQIDEAHRNFDAGVIAAHKEESDNWEFVDD